MLQFVQIADLSPSPRPLGGTRAYHVMVKPGGSICNLDCSYCFYLHKKELLGGEGNFRMPDEILEAHIKQYIEGQDGDEVVFTWQGGEPALLGLEFFEKVLKLQGKYKKPHQRIENDLQTNGTLLNDEWGAFLKRNSFLVGLSIDGPQELHDAYRVSKDHKPTFAKVFATAQMLHRHGVPFNTLTVVNRINARRPREVYRFLRDEIGPREMQFIPCVEHKDFRCVAPQKWAPDLLPTFNSSAAHPGNPDSVVTDWSVDPDDWGYFLCRVWDDWLRHDFGKVFINLFETAIAQWMGKDAQICVYHEFCGKGVALEHNGSVYSCDHYVYPEYKLGNILQTSSSRMVFSQRQMDFGLSKFGSLPARCRNCDYLFACNGECPKNRLIQTPAGEPGLNYLCSGLLRFWDHINDQAREIARCIARGEIYRPHRN
jgi:uncharacterized protein